MKVILYTFLLSFFALTSACKSDNSTNSNGVDTSPNTPISTGNDNTGLPESLERVILKDSPEGDGKWDWTFLTNGILHYKNAMVVGEDASHNPYENQWIDLAENGSYTTGLKSDKSYEGKWNYDNDKKLLTLIPGPADEKNTQWKVMFNDDMLVWVGSERYGDNATQIRLIRHQEYPQ